MATSAKKKSYTISCSRAFFCAVTDLARRRGVNAADVVRSVLLLLPEADIRAFPDPGGPPPGDRETVILKSGPAIGRPWRRKPRLQVRLAAGSDVSLVRRALSLALAIERGEVALRLDAGRQDAALAAAAAERETNDKVERLRTIVAALSFEPLAGGVRIPEEALHVLGFPPRSRPSAGLLRERFRLLATIHHPDSQHGSHRRMSQLNAAMEVLGGGTS
jgi:hypothetical protein